MPIGAIAGIAGGLFSAGASIFGGMSASDASRDAANTQAQAANNATNLQRDIYGQTSKNLFPFLQGGQSGYQALLAKLGINGDGTYNDQAPLSVAPQTFAAQSGNPLPGSDPTNPASMAGATPKLSQFTADPGYQFLQDQQRDIVQNSASGKTGAISGNQLQDLLKYGSGIANQQYGNFYDRYVNNYWQQYGATRQNQGDLLSRLGGVAQGGASAAVNQGNFGNSFGNQAGGNMILGGSAQAAGILGSNNAMQNGINGAINNLGSNAQLQALLAQITGGGYGTNTGDVPGSYYGYGNYGGGGDTQY